MRIAFVIVSLAAIAVCLVNIRRMEMSARHESLRLMELRRVQLKRKHWGQDIDLGYLTAWDEVTRRAGEQGLQFAGSDRSRYCLAETHAGSEAQGER